MNILFVLGLAAAITLLIYWIDLKTTRDVFGDVITIRKDDLESMIKNYEFVNDEILHDPYGVRFIAKLPSNLTSYKYYINNVGIVPPKYNDLVESYFERKKKTN